MSNNPLTAEVSNSKLAAIFPMSASARFAAAALVEQLGFKPAQVKLITPGTADTDIKLEPESGNIWRTCRRCGVRGDAADGPAPCGQFAVGCGGVVGAVWRDRRFVPGRAGDTASGP